EVAEKHGVDWSTLGRRWRGELELVRYITKLNKQGLPPTREIIRNFLLEVAC
ncbi:hypothetical protein BU23DRAFT_556807, partial [Bimuria novae-zelandiae CBS 107.79]